MLLSKQLTFCALVNDKSLNPTYTTWITDNCTTSKCRGWRDFTYRRRHRHHHQGVTSWRLLKCLKTYCFCLKYLPQNPQQKCFTSKCVKWWHLRSPAVQKLFGHSLQTYGFKPSWRRMCTLKLPLLWNFFWQMLHVSQVPSLCDFSRCVLSWWHHVKRSEQCLHEYGFAPVWIRTWSFSSALVLNSLPQ